MIRRTAIFLLIAVVLIALYLSFWPTRFSAEPWQAPAAPNLEADRSLVAISILGDVEGPEDVEITATHILTGLADGRIVQMARQAPHTVTTLVNTGGRPIGLDLGRDGALYLADVVKGLLLWKDGQLTTLFPASETYQFIDDVVIANDRGKLYFSNASTRWTLGFADADILEHQKTGSVIEYDLATKTHRVIAENLSFANGMTLSHDETTLYFTETGEYRVWAYDLKTDTQTVLAENLPGLPDNISTAKDGLWVALFTPRNEVLDSLANNPGLRNAIYRLPTALKPKPAHHALAIKLDFSGKIVRVTGDSSLSAYAPITSVQEVGNQIYFGSLHAKGVGVLDKSAAK